ncbi:unnamed protein product [Phytophthora lilii]|uniref:Unnamed protein product n=1 Tax=Phytophthora lilii TaxID=2077276 RepID=A0A9W6U9G8_9STRA|nr:unnamed protein product [Phytophthora lilii]
MIGVFVEGLSFSDFTSESTLASLPDKRNANTDLTTEDEERIYGGSTADFKQYPYMASLRFGGGNGTGFCGGTLIAPQYVLTAAHCFAWNLTDMYVSIGSLYGSGHEAENSEQIRVVEFFRHPLYKVTSLNYDVALLKLEMPATHQPAKLCKADGSDNTPGTMGTILGWGLINNQNISETLRSVDVEIITDKVCEEYVTDYYDSLKATGNISSTSGYDFSKDETVMCAGRGDGKDSCGGDSGGPLIAKHDVVVGIVSGRTVVECGVAPGTYTNVSYVLPYINEILKGGSSGNVTYLLGGVHYGEVPIS